jgi:fatty acid-binding protein DegV
MARIKIVTDSTSDISLSLAHELGIEIVPMSTVLAWISRPTSSTS